MPSTIPAAMASRPLSVKMHSFFSLSGMLLDRQTQNLPRRRLAPRLFDESQITVKDVTASAGLSPPSGQLRRLTVGLSLPVYPNCRHISAPHELTQSAKTQALPLAPADALAEWRCGLLNKRDL